MSFFRYAKTISFIAALVLAGVVAGCASNTRNPAPVVERTPSRAGEKAAPSVALKPGEYMVKKGDTLRSIALEHGQDYKELAAWNNIENPNVIQVGQVLRVVSPERQGTAPVATASEGVEMRPITPPAQIESLPVNGKPAAAAAGGLKREPKGGTQAYSDEAWAQLQKGQPAQASSAAQQNAASPTAAVASNADTTTKPAAPVSVNTDIAWQWPTTNAIIAQFSESTNKGIDFGGNIGDPVVAAAPGKVTLVTNSLRGYGNLIVVKHNATYLSVYAHNSKMLVSEGQTVAKGQKIAEIGNTDTDRPKLHFEIRREGKPVDPTKFLPQR